MNTDVDLSARAADEIMAWLGRRRMSKSQLARHLGVSHTWVTNRINGSQEIGLNELQRIAAALNVEIGELIPQRSGRLITTADAQAEPRAGTNAHSTRPAERPSLSGQRQRAEGRESSRRPARTVPLIPELMTDDVMAELLEPQAA